MRIGVGYDVHRLVPGRRLVLGGVEFAHPTGLLGHSDADVVCHAIADALLGAAALGDIGHLFPPTDPRYENANSLALLAEVTRLVRERGWRVGNVDATVLAERPRLAPRVEEIRKNLAGALDVTLDQVNVKASTNERLGFVGREEGIAVYAVALLER